MVAHFGGAKPLVAKKRASITDLARQLDVSVSTVSRALNGHASISAATKKRVAAKAKELGYEPNSLAAGLRRGRSKLLGLIVPHIDGNFFSLVVKGIEAAASRAGYHVLICQSNEDVNHERENVDTLLNAQVEGIMVSLARTTREFRHFDKVRRRDMPLVFFDRILEGESVNAVVLDDRAGGYRSTRHLLEQGCRRIAHFAGPQHLNIYKNRRLGYEDALREAGLPVLEELIFTCDMKMADGEAGIRHLLELPGGPPDGLFSASDFSLAGALEVLKQRHLRVPDDVALVGFSNEAFTTLTEPKLTSVDQHCELMGESVTRLLLEIMAEQRVVATRHIVLQPELLMRASSLRRP